MGLSLRTNLRLGRVGLFYQGLFSDDEVRRPLLDGLEFSSIDEADRIILDRQFTEDEVWGV
jgi:hypothetical protein